MIQYAKIAAVCALGFGAFGAGVFVTSQAWKIRYQDLELSIAKTEAAIQATAAAARKSTAEEIAKIKVTNTTINRKVEREIKTDTVYADCRLPDSGMHIANEALAGRLFSSPDSVPGDSAASGK